MENIFESHHRTPIYQLKIITKQGEKDITQIVEKRLMSLTLEDNRGLEADRIDLQLSDHDGALELPPRNAKIQMAIGWQGEGLVDKGLFSVDEVQFSGAPDTLTIRARSADLKGTLTSQKERSFDNIKIGTLIDQIAKENGLQGLTATKYAEQTIKHLDQTNESDINLLTRLAKEYDAIATVKDGKLLFIEQGKGLTASGKEIPSIEINRQTGDSYTFSVVESQNYKAVRAYYYNPDNGKKGEVVVDENSEIKKVSKTTKKGKVSKQKKSVLVQTAPITSDSEQIKTLRHTYKYEGSAINAAKSAFDKLKRGVATFSLTMAYGNPELMPETPVNLTGFKPQIDSTSWIITKVTHNLSPDSGYTCGVEFELFEDESA